jgi:hypothetical protein
MGERRGVYRALVGKPEGRRPLGRPRRRREDNIKMDLQEVGCGGMGWIELAQNTDRRRALVNAAMHILVPLNAGIFFDWLRTGQLVRKDSVPWSKLPNEVVSLFV